MEADGEWFSEGAAGERNGLGELVAHVFGVGGEFHEGAIEMGVDLCRGAEAHLWAEVVAVGEAERAFAAGQPDFEGDAVADSEVLYVGPNGCDDTGGLVAQAVGLAHYEVAIAAVAVVVQVGAAEAGRSNGDLHFSAIGGGDWFGFLVVLDLCVCIQM